MRSEIDITGKTYGDMRVLSLEGKVYGHNVWLCECTVCGAKSVRDGARLRKMDAVWHKTGFRGCHDGGVGSGTVNQQLCWTCQKACGGCSWSKSLKPVKGWTATPTKINIHAGPHYKKNGSKGYKITACPEYAQDERS